MATARHLLHLRNAILYTALASTAMLSLPPPAAAREPQPRQQPQQRQQAQHERREQNRNHYEWRNNRYRVVTPPKAPLRALPPNHIIIRSGQRSYYESQGRYYRREPSGFFVIAPPIGVVVASLPIGAVTVHIGGIVYFLAGGVYYRHHAPSGYIVVTAPIPAADTVDTSAQQVIVQASALNVRSGPGLDYSIVSVTYQGENLPVLGSAPGWYYVRLSSGQVGWVMSNYTVPVRVSPQG